MSLVEFLPRKPLDDGLEAAIWYGLHGKPCSIGAMACRVYLITVSSGPIVK